MNELSLHILDICQNSISANATLIEILINEFPSTNEYSITINDNGCGMDKATVSKVVDPFFTSRKERNVGLGIALFKLAAEQSNGSLTVTSTLNKGTSIYVKFELDHIDRAPLGKIEDTIVVLLLHSEQCDIYYKHCYKDKVYVLDTRTIKTILNVKAITDYDVIQWAKNNVIEGINNIHEEV